MTTPTPQRAVIYCRISKDAERKGLGVSRQERECRDLAERNGWPVAEVYVDNDLSAYNGHRPGYARLLNDLRERRIDAVVAWHPDRLHRAPRELEDFIDVVERAGATVATVTTGLFDLSTPAGRMTARHLGAAARYESEHRSERLVSKHEELARDGRWKGGPRPFGYDLERDARGEPTRSGRLVVVPSEAAIIREAVQRVLAGESVYGVCQDLNRRGVPTAQTRDGQIKHWRTPTLRRILTTPTAAGKREYRGEVVAEALWEPIIDEGDRQRLRRLILDPERSVGRRPRSYLLTGGIARCGRCDGTRLYGQRRGNGRRVYACVKSPDHDGCGGLTCVADPVEALVVEAVFQRLDTPALAAAATPSDDASGHEVDQLVADLEGRLTELAEMFGAGEVTRREWLAAKAKIDRQLEDARRRQTRSDHGRALAAYGEAGALRKAWPSLTLDQRRAVLQAVIERVIVNPSKRRGPVFDPERIDVIWRV